MELYLIKAGIAGLGYAMAAVFSKRALQAGCGILRLSFVINLVFVGVFALLYLNGAEAVSLHAIHLPVITGSLFFLGQLFTFGAIRMGDVSLQTPMMGTKAVFVVLIAVSLGTEAIDVATWGAALLSMLAVALLGFSGGGAKRVGWTLSLALVSSFFFACTDTMVGTYGREYGAKNFVFIAIAVNGLLSFGLLPFFREPLRAIPKRAWKWTLLAALLMGGQALLLNYTLATSQNVASINILYSLRGLWSVVLAAPASIIFAMPREHATRWVLGQRFVGALLMSLAIALVL